MGILASYMSSISSLRNPLVSVYETSLILLVIFDKNLYRRLLEAAKLLSKEDELNFSLMLSKFDTLDNVFIVCCPFH